MPRRILVSSTSGTFGGLRRRAPRGGACAQDTAAAAATTESDDARYRHRDGAKARRVPRAGTGEHHGVHVAESRELQHPVVQGLCDQDAQHLLRLRRRSDRHRGSPHDRDSRHYRTESVRYGGRNRLLHRRHAGPRIRGSSSARHRQHRGAEGTAGYALRRELPGRQRAAGDEEAQPHRGYDRLHAGGRSYLGRRQPRRGRQRHRQRRAQPRSACAARGRVRQP